MKATLDHLSAEADNITSFFWRPAEPISYTAGQYIEMTLKHPRADKRGQKRWFTLSSAPGNELISNTTKFAFQDSSTFKKALFKLEPGAVVDISQPFGDFVLPKIIQTPLVFVAGGIGITPFHSMLEWLAGTKEERPIKLIYGVRNEDEIIFNDTFDKSGVRPTIIVSEPSAAWGGERGPLSAELILGLAEPTADTLVYLSGPEPMIEKLQKDLRKAGLEHKQIVTDFFPGYSQI